MCSLIRESQTHIGKYTAVCKEDFLVCYIRKFRNTLEGQHTRGGTDVRSAMMDN